MTRGVVGTRGLLEEEKLPFNWGLPPELPTVISALSTATRTYGPAVRFRSAVSAPTVSFRTTAALVVLICKLIVPVSVDRAKLNTGVNARSPATPRRGNHERTVNVIKRKNIRPPSSDQTCHR